jgi:toxin CcdB
MPYTVHRVGRTNLVLDVQAGLLDHLNTRVVVPLLRPEDFPEPAARLNPVFEIGGEKWVMVTQFMAAIPAHQLGKPVDDLVALQDEIKSAMDLLFDGF